MGPPTVDNEHLYRQNYAIRDFAKTIKTTLVMMDVNAKALPSDKIKPALKNSFFVNEQRYNQANDFVEPDDEYESKGRLAADYLNDYIK